MRLAGAIGAVRLVVHGFAIRGSWVCCSWVHHSWVVGLLFVGSCDSLFVGSTISSVVRRSPLFWVHDLSLSLSICACESFLSLFLSLRDSENDLKVKFWLKIFSESKALILRSTEILFQKIHFPYVTKYPHLRKNFSGSDLKPKQT